MFLNSFLNYSNLFKSIRYNLNNQNIRDEFILRCLKKLRKNSKILDAGSGSQRYKKYCGNLKYFSNDTEKYKIDENKNLFSDGINGIKNYKYGKIDYKSNIWNIEEKNSSFHAILCTEVFEHIPYPIEAIKEFSRLLKKGGKLILTVPSNCLRHMDPQFYYTGFSNHWLKKFLVKNNFKIIKLETVGDYYSWIAVEISRTAKISNFFIKMILLPAFIFYYFKKSSKRSKNTLCMGYHVLAIKK